MKLYDRIMLYGVHVDGESEAYQASYNESLRRTLPDAVKVEVTNVREYMEAVGKESWSVDDDAPFITPPWPLAWLEYRAVTNNDKRVRVGVLSQAEADPDGGWETSAIAFVTYPGHPVGYAGSLQAHLDEVGRRRGQVDYGLPRIGMPLDAHARELSTMVFPIYLAFSFAHCKNVSTVDHRPPPKVAKKRRKAGKPVGVTYKTLVIDGMKEVLRTEGGVEKNGLKKALHICRGHFATYTADAPLFGKVTGTFWKPMHTRGSKKRGEVKKDYKVIAGE